MKIIRRYHIGGTAMIQWVLQFSQNIVFHGLKIQDSCAANIQGESSDLTHHFTLPCRVPVILSASRNELGDDVTIQFVGHVPQKITCGDGGLTRTPSVDHTVRVIIKHLLLKGV